MPKTKTTPPTAEGFGTTAWTSLFALADETREELHRQVTTLIEFIAGASASVTKLAFSANHKLNHIAQRALKGSEDAGLALVSGTQKTAREATDRVTATAKTLVRPAA